MNEIPHKDFFLDCATELNQCCPFVCKGLLEKGYLIVTSVSLDTTHSVPFFDVFSEDKTNFLYFGTTPSGVLENLFHFPALQRKKYQVAVEVLQLYLVQDVIHYVLKEYMYQDTLLWNDKG
jgi:hypothetical protein